MKTKSKDLELIWEELKEIFLDFHKFTPKTAEKLERLGIEVSYKGNVKHPKIHIVRNGIKHCITLSSTPSDRYAGRQILRQIRAIYERN